MKLLIELDEEYVKAIDNIKFLVGGRTDRKLQLEIIKAIKNGKALEQEPTTETEHWVNIKNCIDGKCDDCNVCNTPTTKNDLGFGCVSRKQAIDAFPDLLPNIGYNKKVITEILQKLPSVTPIRTKGHWIKGYTFPDGAYWKCDKCNELIKVKIPMHYCNNCGADMREVEDGE